jgi:hypothetical protein
MRSSRIAVLMCLMLACMAACSGSSEKTPPRTTARTSFELAPKGEPVFAAYRQTGDLSQEVTLPKGSRNVLIRLDCAGTHGEVKVDLTSAGGAGAECTPREIGIGAAVRQSGDGSLLAREQTIKVTGPNDQEWSVAVYAGTKAESN